jgi:hypothetical protein
VEGRRAGWWGIAFVVLLFIGGGMVSVPTADVEAAKIVAFYDIHASIVIAAQVIGVIALVPLALFVLALVRRLHDPSSARRLIAALMLVVITELVTNVPPLVLSLLSSPSGSTAHAWTLSGDIADAALFASLGLLALALIPGRAAWLRSAGAAVAFLAFVRAVGSPLGFTALDAVAPIAFLAFVVVLSVQMLRPGPGP